MKVEMILFFRALFANLGLSLALSLALWHCVILEAVEMCDECSDVVVIVDDADGLGTFAEIAAVGRLLVVAEGGGVRQGTDHRVAHAELLGPGRGIELTTKRRNNSALSLEPLRACREPTRLEGSAEVGRLEHLGVRLACGVHQLDEAGGTGSQHQQTATRAVKCPEDSLVVRRRDEAGERRRVEEREHTAGALSTRRRGDMGAADVGHVEQRGGVVVRRMAVKKKELRPPSR